MYSSASSRRTSSTHLELGTRRNGGGEPHRLEVRVKPFEAPLTSDPPGGEPPRHGGKPVPDQPENLLRITRHGQCSILVLLRRPRAVAHAAGAS
jgi:hypothetical protein